MPEASSDVRVVGRYALCDRIAGGGMATVHLGRLLGQAGFSRTVAIKRLHAHLAEDPEFVAMFMDEARLAARIHHPNVVSTLDVVARDSELFLVMDYVHGESLARLMRGAAERKEAISPRIAGAIVSGFLHGLHAAHEARSERGEPLDIVHRDVSPQNVLVGSDGVPRVVDFGVAKAVGRVQSTRDGQLKGKLAYMAPEQIQSGAVTRRTDIYAASIILWEMLVGRRLFHGESEAAIVHAILTSTPQAPSAVAGVPPALDRIVLRGLAAKPEARFQTAQDMALAIEKAVDVALPSEVGAWVQSIAAQALSARAALVGNIESSARLSVPAGMAAIADALVASASPSGTPPPVPTEPPTMLTASAEGDVPRRRSRRSIAALAMGTVVGVVGAVLLMRLGQVAPVARGAVAAAIPPQPPSAAVAPPASGSEPASAPPDGTGADATPTASAPPAASSAAPRAARPPQAAPPPAKRPAASSCDPPYRIDGSGRRIFKVECL
jgi:serine/threonine-protein kinase